MREDCKDVADRLQGAGTGSATRARFRCGERLAGRVALFLSNAAITFASLAFTRASFTRTTCPGRMGRTKKFRP